MIDAITVVRANVGGSGYRTESNRPLPLRILELLDRELPSWAATTLQASVRESHGGLTQSYSHFSLGIFWPTLQDEEGRRGLFFWISRVYPETNDHQRDNDMEATTSVVRQVSDWLPLPLQLLAKSGGDLHLLITDLTARIDDNREQIQARDSRVTDHPQAVRYPSEPKTGALDEQAGPSSLANMEEDAVAARRPEDDSVRGSGYGTKPTRSALGVFHEAGISTVPALGFVALATTLTLSLLVAIASSHLAKELRWYETSIATLNRHPTKLANAALTWSRHSISSVYDSYIGPPATGLSTVTVTVKRLRVRASPEIEGAVLETRLKGDHLIVVSASGEWDQVKRADGSTGWVIAKFVRADRD